MTKELDPASLRLEGVDVVARARNPLKIAPGEMFIRTLPLPWVTAAAKLPGRALHVGLAIWFRVGLKGSATVKLTRRSLDALGVDRFASYRALRALERARLITVDRRRGRAPIVTVRSAPVPSCVS